MDQTKHMNKVTFFRRGIALFAAVCGLVSMAAAQAVLPTTYGFDSAAPAGWSDNLTGTLTYASGQSGLAARLDATNEYVQVFFAEEPGVLSYYIKGSVGGGTTSWSGTFTVQESVDGSNWTALRTFGNGQLDISAHTLVTDTPLNSSRYIRFFFTNKVSGSNVSLDEINLATPTAGAAQEINVVQGGNNIPNGFTFASGNTAATTFTIENQGLTADLNISDIALSGANASEFSIANAPTVVGAESSADFILNFNPIGTGSRFCTITISNDDATENPYVINVYAVSGDFATEPTNQATGLTFTGVRSWDHNVAFGAGASTADGYVVLVRAGAAVADLPVDGVSYQKGQWIGSSKVAYIGEAGSFNARSIVADTDYHYAVVAYNGTPGYENYLTTSPLTGVAASPDANIGTYYNGVNHNDANFLAQLKTAQDPTDYFQIFYSNYSGTIVPDFYVADTVVNNLTQNVVTCQYSNVPYIYENAFVWWNGSNTGTMSREHCFPQSWMPTYLETGFDDSRPVSDLHILLPVLQEECNAVRSNFPYGEVVTPTSTFQDCKYGPNEFGQNSYEPRDAIKGDAARAIFYCTTKNAETAFNWSLPEQISLTVQYGQNEYLLKKWHFEDLPDNMEKARNEYVEFKQNNRNAFIDSTLFPCYIRFSNLTKYVPQTTFNTTSNLFTAIDPALSYQWFKDGEAIPGATSSTYTATANGVYTVASQQFEQCPTFTSNATTVSTIGVNEVDGLTLALSVFPNPSQGEVRMNITAGKSEMAQVRVMDLAGNVVYQSNTQLRTGNNSVALDLNLAAGVYLIDVQAKAAHVSSKLVVE